MATSQTTTTTMKHRASRIMATPERNRRKEGLDMAGEECQPDKSEQTGTPCGMVHNTHNWHGSAMPHAHQHNPTATINLNKVRTANQAFKQHDDAGIHGNWNTASKVRRCTKRP
eukprot:10992879-Alexandrium_andersonii.AAC.1